MSRLIGTLSSHTAFAVAATEHLDTRWMPPSAARGQWLLDMRSTNHERLSPADLAQVVSGLIRPKQVEILADDTVRAHTLSDQDTRAAQTTINASLTARELGQYVVYVKLTEHAPTRRVSDGARDGHASIVEVGGTPMLSLPAGTWEITESDDGAVTLTRK